ncbi:unnamed protein product [Rhizoctonia solani]|uniref:Uncharacterized protein n=1 Tax=Rhizoctonia solani TaxID=456999 RepID=A0A8H3A323_9AGAM|nr:unnamed protein product [Rhizoctonia solani]
MAVANMESDTSTELMLILSGHVSRVIKSEIERGNGGQAFGWARVTSQPRLQLTPLMLRCDILQIFSMLWDDRQQFLKTFMMTHSPRISGVIFVLWRYLHSSSLFTDEPPSKNFAIPFSKRQIDQWTDRPKHVTLDDLPMILQAYTGRMSPVDSRTYSSLEIDAIVVLLSYVTQIMQPGVEILLPPLIATTLDRIWDALSNMKEGNLDTISHIGHIFMF